MNRRSFLKTLCAAVGVSAIPSIGIALPAVPEPEWIVALNDFDMELAVAASWGSGANRIRHAVRMPTPERGFREEGVEYCKQALRQWYLERQLKAA